MDLKEINLLDWELAGEGNQGESYNKRGDDSVMLKLYQDFITEEAVLEEYRFNLEIQRVGIPAPKVLEMVRCGNRYGILFQRVVNKKSLARLSGEQPQRIPEFAKRLAQAGKLLHGFDSTGTKFSRTIDYYRSLMTPERQLLEEETVKMEEAFVLVEKEDARNIIHGDFHFGNLITDGEKDYLIDLGTISLGNPKWDTSMLFMMCHMIPEHMMNHMFHMTVSDAQNFWEEFKKNYYGVNVPSDEQLWKELAPYLYMRTLFFTDGKLLDVNRRFRAEIGKLF